MRRSYLGLLAAALAVTASAGCGGSVTTAGTGLAASSPTATSAVQPSDRDKTWLRKTHRGNLAEIGAGRLAEQKGTSQQVKSIGEMLVKDHGELDKQVVELAGKLGVKLPEGMSEDQRAQAKKLANASSAQFDREFVTQMTAAHKVAIAATKQEIDRGSSPEVVALAKSALPALEDHLSLLEKAAGS
ncbi:DUF4142 domain-containing protein [Nonomuraea cavernae]|nr:DUF4142 domain-containing protein [Nonomuraea cavernae]MCA2183806.1 DUF4142 domain-containing protein [Nonomuraea cavernae]